MANPTFTVADVLQRVRLLKSDATYASATARLWVRDALLELFTQAEKTRQDENGQVTDIPVAFTADTDVVPCSILYLPLLVDYVLARSLMEDADSQEHAARADKHLTMFFQRAHWVEHGPVQFNERTLGALLERR